jgi:phage FluMu gp28-like protein
MIAMRRTAMDKKRSGQVKPLTADDQLVAQEYQLDMSKCPADFQLAMFRFMMTEDTARLHAHMDRTGKAEKILGAGVEGFATHGLTTNKSVQSLISYDEKISDQQKKDLANMQAALQDVAQVATKYGVK